MITIHSGKPRQEGYRLSTFRFSVIILAFGAPPGILPAWSKQNRVPMSAFDFFDDIWCIHHAAKPVRWPAMQARLARLGIGERARRFPSVPSPADERIGRALSHRRIVQDAAERGLRCVLAIEDETLFLDRTEAVLTAATAELRGRQWKLLHLGTWRGSDGLAEEPDAAICGRPATAAACRGL